MKKALFLVAALGGFVYASCAGPYCWDDNGAQVNGGLGIAAIPSATVRTTTPNYVGQMIECSDCGVRLCISTATSAGAFSSAVSSTSHCQ